jgi:hypothetical protein
VHRAALQDKAAIGRRSLRPGRAQAENAEANDKTLVHGCKQPPLFYGNSRRHLSGTRLNAMGALSRQGISRLSCGNRAREAAKHVAFSRPKDAPFGSVSCDALPGRGSRLKGGCTVENPPFTLLPYTTLCRGGACFSRAAGRAGLNEGVTWGGSRGNLKENAAAVIALLALVHILPLL